MTQGCDFEMFALGNRRDRSVVDAGRYHLDARALQHRHHLMRLRSGGDVHVIGGTAEHGIAHAATDETNLGTVATQGLDHARRRPRSHGSRQRDASRLHPRLHPRRRLGAVSRRAGSAHST